MSEAADDPTTGAKNSSPPVDPSPDQFANMETIDVVHTILGVDVSALEPYQVLPPSDPNNPLDCDRDIDLSCTARDLLKEGKTGKLFSRSSSRIKEETISKMVKKGDEHKERKKVVASNVE